MPDSEIVRGLLLTWDENPAATPEELCRPYEGRPDHADLLEAVRQAISQLLAVSPFLAASAVDSVDASPVGPPPAGALAAESQMPGHGCQRLPFRGAAAGPADLYPTRPDPTAGQHCPDTQAARAGEGRAAAAAACIPVVPHYEVLSELGRGGMGVVYLARQAGLGRLVALKMVLAGGHAGRAELARFRREAEAAAKVQHPNIAQVYEVGEADGQPFFSLEHCPGGSLAQTLDGTPWPPKRAAALAETLARAVHAAHRAGVVHRDLKPSNVLLAADGTPKVSDFGLAKRLDGPAGQTTSRAVLGTPSYMAPEQAAGKVREVGVGTDVYGLGAVLYELLTGRPPFKAATAAETQIQVLRHEPVSPRHLQPRLPRDLETICLKCLAKESLKRYLSAQDLADELTRFLQGSPIQARPVGQAERLRRWCRRNPLLAGLSAAIALLVAVIACGSVMAVARLSRTADDARQAAAREAIARQREEAAQRAAENAVVDAYTASGLGASERGDGPLAVLWFANAARLARNDPERELSNRIRVQTWSRDIPFPVQVLAHPDRLFRSLAFHPRLPYLLTVSIADRATLWDLDQGRPNPFPRSDEPVSNAAWSPDGRWLVLGTRAGELVMCEFPGGQICHRSVQEGPVRAIAFSPTGRYLAWAGRRVTRVWNTQDRAYLSGELTHPEPVRSISFSGKEDRLVLDGEDSKARVFAIADDAVRTTPLFPPVPHVESGAEIDGNQGRPIAPIFVDADNALLTLGRNTTLTLWDATTGQRIREIRCPLGATYDVQSIGLNGDASTLVVGWHLGAQMWEVKTGKALGTYMRHPNNVTAVDFQKGTGVFLLACRSTVRLLSGDRERPLSHALPHSANVHLAKFSPGGDRVATAEDGGTVRVWALPTGSPSDYHVGAPTTFTRVVLSRDGELFLPTGVTFKSADMTSTQVHQTTTGRPVGQPIKPGGIILAAGLSPDGTRVAVAITRGSTSRQRRQVMLLPGGKAGNLQLWDWRKGKLLLSPVDLPSEPRGLDFSPEGRHLAVLCAGGELLMLRCADGFVTQRMDSGSRYLKLYSPNWWNYVSNGLVRFNRDGTKLASWGTDETTRVWDAITGRLLFPPLPHKDRCLDVDFSPVGDFLATASFDHSVQVWNTNTGQPAGPALTHPDRTYSARFSPDGQELLTACRDGMARLWNWQTGDLIGLGMNHEDEVLDVAFVPNSPWVVSTGYEGTLRLWERSTGRLLMPPQLLGGYGLNVAVTPDGRFALVAGLGGHVRGIRLDNLVPSGSPAELCRLGEMLSVNRITEQGSLIKLNAEEWQQRWRATPTGR